MFRWKRSKAQEKGDVNLARYETDRSHFISSLGGASEWTFGNDFPITTEWGDQAGAASGHYFHQDLWAARNIYVRNPARHIDVGSRIDGFVAHVASFRKIEIYDIRPLASVIPNITFVQQNFMLSAPSHICDSLSCLHALEHFGLGRYGDPIDAWGYVKGFSNISQMLKPGGSFYFSVPIGRQRIEFNAHRIFGLRTIQRLIKNYGFEIVNFSYVDDSGNMHENCGLDAQKLETDIGLLYGCGLFDLVKSG